MDALNGLKGLGLELPSVAYLIGSILFGIVGWVAFRRGRKTATSALTWAGLALMLYPYGVAETWMLWAIGVALCAWVWFKWNQ